ncbi:hypothetical protein PsorP6_012918 [Peronosclerospora sorghi]|uniref:Uncharacterized protein n=1 Tax=Peronosclerospora sorghi TaxID=230839 RepID=A0ACC0WGW4_9STRA|nr:hypothetical protein PsorP6_012918 [Peronosclerospora sorghi]
MSSGFGFKGREGRCYQFWKSVEQCSRETELTGQCGKEVEDYLECLQHRKEVSGSNNALVFPTRTWLTHDSFRCCFVLLSGG